MRIKVMKFGGTSVATAEARAASCQRVITAKEQGFNPVVVVSAIGRRGAPYATDTLLGMLRDIDPNVPPEPREVDLLISCGEILSSVIFAHTLKIMGVAAQAFRGGQAGIYTDGVYGNARITRVNPEMMRRSLEAGYVPVISGFQGIHVVREAPDGKALPGGELTTLGRGGSDTTAAAVGAALHAEAVEIYTDVDGVKTADPDYVKEAPTLRTVTYDEVAEIAHLGAKVLHPRAAEIAMQYGIPLWVKSTFSDDPGTEIVAKDSFPGRRVTGVTHTGRLVYLQFDLSCADEKDRTSLETRIFDLMSRNSLNLHLPNLSPESTGFAVPRDQFQVLKDLLDGLVVPVPGGKITYLLQVGREASKEVETQAEILEPIGQVSRIVAEVTEGCTMVSLVGHEYMQQPGVFLNVLRELTNAEVTVLQTTDSDYSLSLLVPETDTRKAVKTLHDRFGLVTAV
jgi:aspartate kinase